ncbi:MULTISPECIES: glycoside hydrolase family 76 protein [Saccharibacillus]|uniref:glycoside hydrolase family 76 protein n=1 Tax=Saccharibacillus TaxID=456492 RepID=UPI0012389F0C|nr:glycoside hydrolase family 76 protein [Saccharibacillus sp. WB 17]MWJ33893.1 glycoside hydrolase [Saccharibacillus sp. WB 17]
MTETGGIWAGRADEAQRVLEQRFWNEGLSMYDIETPCPGGTCNTIFHYWWMAHAADVLIDAYERTGEPFYASRLGNLYEGVLARNGGAWPNELYDDMEWMALAWLRAYEATGEERYRHAVLQLWADIRTGWNEEMRGGIAWHKNQPGYKNTPANAPAVILAARLYRAFGSEDDLHWARRIYVWLQEHLVNPETGFVWDGMNRAGDGAIDYDWQFTYCQGVFVGAAVELYRCTGDRAYAADAARTLAAARGELAGEDGVLPAEGGGDAGLFKGILARYAAEAALFAGEAADGLREAATWIGHNARVLWAQGRRGEAALFGPDWRQGPQDPVVQLCTQLSGVMLFESAARLESRFGADTFARDSGGAEQKHRPSADRWGSRADEFQERLYARYRSGETGILNQWFPAGAGPANENFYYWWQAHVIDTFVDALERTGDARYARRISDLSRNLRRANGGTFLHQYYDDMEWLALALLRAYSVTGEDSYKADALELWADIRTAWNDFCGGGMAWKKDQLDYKNTPANAPAAILAARLYRLSGDEGDLEWAEETYAWNRDHLVDPETGFVWDGMNRLGDGAIDYDWKFTYCQGVMIGAGVELYRCTGEPRYLEDALRTAEACIDQLCEPETLKLPDEGIDDTGLFKGILIRYLVLLLEERPDLDRVRRVISNNAELLWRQGLDADTGLCGPDWAEVPAGPVQLAVQLSGVMLTEAAARIANAASPRTLLPQRGH